ncbi:MAG: response regulator [Anaerolineae bacterium]
MTDETRRESKGNILVVDDTPMNLKLLSEMLTQYGYKVRAARDGAMALMSVQAALPDLILLDIKMNTMDGYEVCQRLKANDETRDIPVIFISALNDTENIVKGFEVGGADYVTKPFQFREVLARVENHLTIARQRRQIEDLRERDREYYETLSKLRDQFVRAATHDLKNPLALITGYVGLMRSHELIAQNDEIQQYIVGIRQGTEKILELVTDMLDLAQMESGLELHLAPVDLNKFLERIVMAYAAQAVNCQLDLSFAAAPENPVLHIDAPRMERAVNNLVSNAIKYTPRNGQVVVRARVKPGFVCVQVEDTGYGIPHDAMDRLFEAFFRVRRREHQQIDGTGLGLSIVKAIVEQHDGEIHVESELGKGSVFSILLPL